MTMVQIKKRSTLAVSEKITQLIQRIPGHSRFGIVTIMPLFFLVGAALEFTMIKWKPNGVNFYEVYERKELEKLYQQYEEIGSVENSLTTEKN